MYWIESEDIPSNYFDDYKGEIYRLLEIKSIIDIDRYVLITEEKTINEDRVKINLYWRNKKLYSARYKTDNWNSFTMNDLFNWFYMDKIADELRMKALLGQAGVDNAN